MNNRIKLLLVSTFLLFAYASNAQEGAYSGYSPYSVYGIGDLSKAGNAFNKSMGGVGVASRNRRYLNTLNPAACTSMDTLSFMCNFGISENNEIYRSGSNLSANNTFNMTDFSMGFPIYKSLSFMCGISQFSEVGYDFSSIETDPAKIMSLGNLGYQAYGQGGLNELFAAAGVEIWKKLSLGAQICYYFGKTEKVSNTVYSEESYRAINAGNVLQINGLTGKFGMQYSESLGSGLNLTVGATYRLKTNMRGNTQNYTYAVASEMKDTVSNTTTKLSAKEGLKLGNEIGIGISVSNGERWMAEIDYQRSDWSKCGFETFEGLSVKGIGGIDFSSSVSNSVKAGFEFTPNRNDIRYYHKKITYRGGLYFDQAYYRLNGKSVDSKGITFGVTLPVLRMYNGVSLGADIGQRGNTGKGMIRETYFTFNIGFNMHDIWFQKQRFY